MRVLRRETASTILVLTILLITMTFVPEVVRFSLFDADSNDTSDKLPETQESIQPIEDMQRIDRNSGQSILSYDYPIEGILNPVLVEQSGYAASGNVSARTDSFQNLDYDLPLDTTHNWIADEVEATLWNLEKLYAVNGSFSEGIPGINVNPNTTILEYYPLGWYANSTDTATYPDDVQLAAYENTGQKYVMLENQGGKVGQKEFGHDAGTRVVWAQSVQNSPYTEDFLLSFDYFYLRGPLDKGGDSISGNCSIKIFINGNPVWSMSLLTLSQRGVWLESGSIPLNITGAPSTFVFEIGLYIDQDLVLDIRDDYDNNGIADGIGNAAYITVYLDDVSFIKSIPPTAEQVQLEFLTGGLSEAFTGSMGTYYASITNSSYWNMTTVSVAIASNTSVSFEYKTRLYSHRFTDSNWRTDISSLGVAYVMDHGNSSDLTFYTYIGYLGEYEDPMMTIVFPPDWDNLIVSDPFLTPLTGSCIIGNGSVIIPTSIIDRLGWWEIKIESPNYAKSIKPQIFDTGWTYETLFRIGNTTRADITIGTDTQTLGSLTGVNVTWFKPSDDVWISETLPTGGILGQIYSTPQTFLSGSSPAGQWWVEVFWTNGTEIAYDRASFEMRHTANLIADPSLIETNTGLTVTGIVRYTDDDTGVNLLDPIATIEANWSISIVPFAPNSIHNWWEATLDTSIIGAGVFTVIVNASRQFYDDTSCIITVNSIRVTRLTSPNAPWTSVEWGHTSSLTFNFQVYDYGPETWGPVVNDTHVSVNINWTSGYWTVEEDITPGIYILHLNTSAKNAGTWLLNTTFSKPNHQSKVLLLTLIVSPITSSLTVFGDISARVNIEQPYSVKLSYRDSGGYPIVGASVVIDSISPATGISDTGVAPVGGEPGNYSTSLTPHGAGVFTIRFVATESNAEPATTVFVLVVNDIATTLDIAGAASVEIGLTDVYSTTFRFAMSNGTGVGNAQINITYTGGVPDALSWDLHDLGSGDYSVDFNSTTAGTYLITIAAFKQYYQSDSDAFFLIVREITTHLTSLNGTADVVGFGKNYRLFVNYTSNLGIGLSEADVHIENVVPATGLSWENTTSESQGLYSILLTPQESNTFTVLVRANLFNHQTQFVLFTLTATAIATTLTVLNTSTAISFDQTFTVHLLFQDEDLVGMENASLSVQNPSTSLSFSTFSPLGNGYYSVTITPLEIGTFDIIFKANKSGYQNGYSSFTLGSIRIPTNLYIPNNPSSDSVMFSENYSLYVVFERTDTDVNITGAEIDIQSTPELGIHWSWSEFDDGYLINIQTTRIGRWTLMITSQKTGYASSTIEFILDAEPIIIDIELLSGNSVIEGQLTYVQVRLTQHGTSIPVTNATVSFRISVTGTGNFLEMDESSTDGVYVGQISLPLYSDETEYLLEIKIEKDNYLYPEDIYQQQFFKTIDFGVRMMPIVYGSSGIFAALFTLFALLRISTKRKKKQLEIDLVNKSRFDDADNIIGVIILHKKSGLPVYSKMMKGGFEEGIVAAFITAVTHFREEFEMFDEETITVMPISDIIRAVQTKNLICALITVKSASIDHNRRMEEFARQVSAYLDDLFEDKPNGIIDQKIVDMIEYIFNKVMDGFLLQFYKVATSEKFPKRYELLDETLHDTDTRHCTKPTLLAKNLANYGIPEARGCTLVLEAIQKELIVLCEDDEAEVPEVDFTDFFSKPDRSEASSIE